VTSQRPSLAPYAWLSLGAATVIIVLKTWAYWVTGSVGLLSDALESLVNFVAAAFAVFVLIVVARPADEDHQYGHDKAEYFSSGLEGGLILVAALAIAVAAIERLLHPRPLEQVGLGLGLSVIASILNLIIARVLLAAGRRHDSITLEADGHHLMTDVWTSAGVLVGVGLVAVSGLLWLDPLVALLAAAKIVWTAVDLLKRSVLGLMDTALPPDEQAHIRTVLDRYRRDGVEYHALRTRRSGARRFISLHVLVPGAWSVQRGHDLVEKMEDEMRGRLANATITTHMEPLEDPRAWRDASLAPVQTPEEKT